MDKEIQKLIEDGILFCGKIIDEDGIVRFERVDSSMLEDIPEEERAYATSSMGRAIFTIDKNGKTHNFKGVDSRIELSKLGPMELANAKHIEYSQGDDKYKISSVVFVEKRPEIRINGTSPLEDVEIEGDINKRMERMGVKVPQIKYIREIPQEFSKKHGLPIKIDGSLDELESDYVIEDDERKHRLALEYGENYSQDLEVGKRPETLKEFLDRIGFLSSPDVVQNVESLGFSMQDFIDAVDKNYSRGQRYGQAERVMDSPFRITDLEANVKNESKDKVQSLMDFSEKLDPNFPNDMAEIFGKNIAILMNNGWEVENFMMRQDFSLIGEFCDDAYIDIIEKRDNLSRKYQDKPYIADAEFAEMKRKFTGQVMHVASCIKVVQDAMQMIGKSQKELDDLLDTFVDGFVQNLDMQKLAKLFNVNEQVIQGALVNEFSQKQNWVEKMAGLNRKGGIILDPQVLNAHQGNEEYYDKVSEIIADRLKLRFQNKNNTQENTSQKMQNDQSTQNTDDEGR